VGNEDDFDGGRCYARDSGSNPGFGCGFSGGDDGGGGFE
jgi:hypothetical protein